MSFSGMRLRNLSRAVAPAGSFGLAASAFSACRDLRKHKTPDAGFMDVFPWASGQQEENSGSGRCVGDVLQLSLRVKEFCTSSGLRKKQLHRRGPRCSPTCTAPQLYPRIMKLILLKLNLISINYPPESLSHCWTELNSFHLLFPGLFATRQTRCKTKFHQVKGESCVPAQCLSCCLILRLSLVSWLSRADGL